MHPIKIAIVGDVHYDWKEDDEVKALQFLNVDLVLFTGDFGLEAVEIVRSANRIPFPKAIILGNHDNNENAYRRFLDLEDKVQQQLDILGGNHVGYDRKDFPQFQLSIVGGRPFSLGGSKWRRDTGPRYGIFNFDESAEKIIEVAMATPAEHSIIFLAHNGPAGLGSAPDSICGKDSPFRKSESGDVGDVDLRKAVDSVYESGRNITAVIFGHMHNQLYGSTDSKPAYRKMIATDELSGIRFINGAVVPRHEPANVFDPNLSPKLKAHQFTVLEVEDGKVLSVQSVWVAMDGKQDPFIVHSRIFVG